MTDWSALHDKIQSIDFKFDSSSGWIECHHLADLACKNCPFNTTSFCSDERVDYIRWLEDNHMIPWLFL